MSCDDPDKNKHDIFLLLNGVKFVIENIAKTVFFQRFNVLKI